jgi:uncharacterized damage-inducible protein DinB
MAEEMTKAELLQRLRAGHERWEALLGHVREERMTERGATGAWSVKDVIAHVADGERWLAEQLALAERGEAPSQAEIEQMAREGLTDNEKRNQNFFAAHHDDPLEGVRSEARESYRMLVAALEATSEETLRRPHWSGAWTLAQVVPGECFEHYAEHEPPLRAWLGTVG